MDSLSLFILLLNRSHLGFIFRKTNLDIICVIFSSLLLFLIFPDLLLKFHHSSDGSIVLWVNQIADLSILVKEYIFSNDQQNNAKELKVKALKHINLIYSIGFSFWKSFFINVYVVVQVIAQALQKSNLVFELLMVCILKIKAFDFLEFVEHKSKGA